MNMNSYKWCAVPQCYNTSIRTPNKLFVLVPHEKNIRAMWLKLARRDSTVTLPSTNLYFCEDHFYLPNDMENYMQYRLMGSVAQIRMRPGCVPFKFQCQADLRKQSYKTTKRPYTSKRQRKVKKKKLGSNSAGNLDLEYICNSCHSIIPEGCHRVCVPCVHELCAACCEGAHNAHYVLRAPRGRTQAEVTRVIAKLQQIIQDELNSVNAADSSDEEKDVQKNTRLKSIKEDPVGEEGRECHSKCTSQTVIPEVKIEYEVEVHENPVEVIIKEEPPEEIGSFISPYEPRDGSPMPSCKEEQEYSIVPDYSTNETNSKNCYSSPIHTADTNTENNYAKSAIKTLIKTKIKKSSPVKNVANTIVRTNKKKIINKKKTTSRRKLKSKK